MAIGALFACASHAGFAAITVGAGSSVNFGNAVFNLACLDLRIAGQAEATAATFTGIANLGIEIGGSFAPGASQITLGVNFSDVGTFTAGTSRVSLVDACGAGASQFTGVTGFYDLSVTSALGKQLVLPVGTAQSIAHSLTLQGIAGNLLRVTSASAGQQAMLAVAAGAVQAIAYVTARDNQATAAAIAPGPAATYNSVDGGNLVNWFVGAVPGGNAIAQVPALSPWSRLAIGLGVLLAHAWCARARSRTRATSLRNHFAL